MNFRELGDLTWWAPSSARFTNLGKHVSPLSLSARKASAKHSDHALVEEASGLAWAKEPHRILNRPLGR